MSQTNSTKCQNLSELIVSLAVANSDFELAFSSGSVVKTCIAKEKICKTKELVCDWLFENGSKDFQIREVQRLMGENLLGPAEFARTSLKAETNNFVLPPMNYSRQELVEAKRRNDYLALGIHRVSNVYLSLAKLEMYLKDYDIGFIGGTGDRLRYHPFAEDWVKARWTIVSGKPLQGNSFFMQLLDAREHFGEKVEGDVSRFMTAEKFEESIKNYLPRAVDLVYFLILIAHSGADMDDFINKTYLTSDRERDQWVCVHLDHQKTFRIFFKTFDEFSRLGDRGILPAKNQE